MIARSRISLLPSPSPYSSVQELRSRLISPLGLRASSMVSQDNNTFPSRCPFQAFLLSKGLGTLNFRSPTFSTELSILC